MINTIDTTYDIINRFISIPVNTTTFAVMGDNASRVLNFRISRFIDGVDLSKKEAHVCFKNALGQTGDSLGTNIRYTNSVLEFDWIVPSEVASASGNVEFYVEFREIDEEKARIYCLRTKSIVHNVEESFNIDNSAQPSDYTIETLFLNDNSNHIAREDLVDSELPFRVIDRDIVMSTNKVIAVLKDNLSQMLTFRVKRFVDGIDRADKAFCFKYVNANNDFDICIASNVSVHEDEIFIGWGLDSKVTGYAGTVTFVISALGYLEDGSLYVWNTKPAQFTVEDSLDVQSTMVKPVQSWFDSWVIEADNILQQSARYANETIDLYNTIYVLKDEINTLSAKAREQANLAQLYAEQVTDLVERLDGLYAIRDKKDVDGIFTIVRYYRRDNTLYMTSTLESIYDTYDQRTEVKYDVDGETVVETSICPIIRDIDGIVIGHLGMLNQLQYHGLV